MCIELPKRAPKHHKYLYASLPSTNLISGSLKLLHCNFHTESSQAQFAVPSRSSFEANLPGGLVRFGPFIIIIKGRNDTLKSNALTLPNDLGRKLDTEWYSQEIERLLRSDQALLLFHRRLLQSHFQVGVVLDNSEVPSSIEMT